MDGWTVYGWTDAPCTRAHGLIRSSPYANTPNTTTRQAYIHAITSTRPKVQYRVGIDAKGLFPFLQVRLSV